MVCDILQRIRSLSAAVTFSHAHDVLADVRHTWSEGWSVGRACVDLWDPVLTRDCLHYLASPDQENHASPWDSMICNIQLANSQGVYIKILTYHVDNFFTRVPICLGESHSPREVRKSGWIGDLEDLVSKSWYEILMVSKQPTQTTYKCFCSLYIIFTECRKTVAQAIVTSTLRGLRNAVYSRTWRETIRRQVQQERTVLQTYPGCTRQLRTKTQRCKVS